MQIGVVTFPGSNADWDAVFAVRHVLGMPTVELFHTQTELGELSALVIPGGFAYGDYLRCGAIACFSPIIPAIRRFAERGGPILGICNGFQILTEMHLLPGALIRNRSLRFECRDVFLRVESTGAFTQRTLTQTPDVLQLPIAHGEGCYYCDVDTLKRLNDNQQVALRYVDATGEVSADIEVNVNGSIENIAGIYNERKTILGLMPHPERAVDPLGSSGHGKLFFERMNAYLKEQH